MTNQNFIDENFIAPKISENFECPKMAFSSKISQSNVAKPEEATEIGSGPEIYQVFFTALKY